MKHSVKVVTFDFVFKYPRSGHFAEESAICVAEPNYAKQAVFHRMRTFATQAEKGVIAWLATQPPRETPAASSDSKDDNKESEISALDSLRFGLPPETYLDLVDYVQKALSSSPQLAWVGADADQPMAERVALNPSIWESLGTEGGMDAVEQVVSEFASFFLGRATKKASSTMTVPTDGLLSLSEPLATVTEASPTSKRQRHGR